MYKCVLYITVKYFILHFGLKETVVIYMMFRALGVDTAGTRTRLSPFVSYGVKCCDGRLEQLQKYCTSKGLKLFSVHLKSLKSTLVIYCHV